MPSRPLPRFALLLPALLASLTLPALASGGEELQANPFNPESYVAPKELVDYGSGKLGVVQPSYWRIYLLLAYRAARGTPLSATQVKDLDIHDWHATAPLDPSYESDSKPRIEEWLKTRQTLPGAKPVQIEAGRPVDEQNKFNTYLNCPPDAFIKASATLIERSKRDPRWAVEWRNGQDTVFANCSGGSNLPAKLATGAPDWLVADRAYQRAAALFYSRRFDEAHAAFLDIAKDKASPWQGSAAYLAARCLIRKATLEPVAKPEDADKTFKALMQQAHDELLPLAASQPAAKRLLGWVDARGRPRERMEELAQMLSEPKLPEELNQTVVDYLFVMDNLDINALLEAKQPMTLWLATMQAGNTLSSYERPDAKELARLRSLALGKARAQWESSRDPLWLVPILAQAAPGAIKPEELKAANAVPANAPLYLTLRHQLARLALAQRHYDKADTLIESAMQSSLKGQMAPSTVNAFKSLQLAAARSRDAFFAAAPREQVLEPGDAPASSDAQPAKSQGPAYDDDALTALNKAAPLSMLFAALERLDLPASQRKALSESLWTRAVLRGDYASADKLVDTLAKPRQTTRALWERFRQAKDGDARKVATALILINTPELHPFVPLPRSYFSSYWWCSLKDKSDDRGTLPVAALRFLDPAKQADVDKEQAALASLPNGTDYLAPTLIEWARANPKDPQAPKALHLLVRATKGGCLSPQSSRYSREAFTLLHKQWPSSEWTSKTPYHY
ncbi:hypothetical protein [Chitinimonas sp.]|uniref:hypothetical protein n=1 Tax=Chitinimonas sp. TaxID=1934313 RepID=UPI0035B17A95